LTTVRRGGPLDRYDDEAGAVSGGKQDRASLPHHAVLEIWGTPFCEACAREQEAYFAIGKLTMQPQGLASDRELAGRIAEAGKH
jgi:hypothetical protein